MTRFSPYAWAAAIQPSRGKPIPDPPIPDAPGGSRPRTFRSDAVFTICVLVGLYLCWLVRDVLLMVYISALFAVILSPPLQWICSRKVFGHEPSRATAVAILMAGIIGVLVGFLAVAFPPVTHDLREFLRDLPRNAPVLLARVQRIPLANRLDLPRISAQLENDASFAAGYVITSLPSWAGRIFDIITTLVLMVYFMLEGDASYQWFLSFFPTRSRRRLDATLRRADMRIGKWLLAQATLMMIIWLASTIVFGFMHLPYYFLLGVLMGLANIVPVAGDMAATALACLVAATYSWGKVLGVLIFYAVYMQIENAYLTPRIMRNSVNLAGLAVIVALLFGAALAGIPGALVAVPTAALVSVLIDEYLVQNDVPVVN